jgi:hypothetical protein
MLDASVSEDSFACTAERHNKCGGDHRDDRVDGETGCQKIRLKVELSNEMRRLWNITKRTEPSAPMSLLAQLTITTINHGRSPYYGDGVFPRYTASPVRLIAYYLPQFHSIARTTPGGAGGSLKGPT